MLLVKQELLGSLAAELEKLFPGSGGKAAFESPKVAAHGDWACTAAMQLAKPLKQNPRQVAESLRAALLESAPFQHWVEAVEIAGPGFLNIRLKTVAKQQVVREVLAAGDAFGRETGTGERVLVEFVSANPTGPLHVGHGRQAALGDAIDPVDAREPLHDFGIDPLRPAQRRLAGDEHHHGQDGQQVGVGEQGFKCHEWASWVFQNPGWL
jgi:arginyl-tRNA synthetase